MHFIFSGDVLVFPENLFSDSDNFYSHLFHLDTFHIAFPPGYDIDCHFTAARAGPVLASGGEFLFALMTAERYRPGREIQHGPVREGIFADDLKVELDTFPDDPGKLPRDDVNAGDFLCFSFPGFIHG